MRIIYIGAERVGLACLQKLAALRKNVIAVVTADDSLRPKIADFVPFDDPVADLGIPLVKVKNCQDREFIEYVQVLQPDLLVVISWSQILPTEVLSLPALGCVGMHYSLLPARRGGAPLNWALIDGLNETGITLYFMDSGIDTGDIIANKALKIDREDTIKTLLDKVVSVAPQLLAENIELIEKGIAPRIKQDEKFASYTPRRRPADGLIDWSKSEQELYNFIRALSPPYPCAFTYVGEKRLVIPAARWREGKLWIEGFLE